MVMEMSYLIQRVASSANENRGARNLRLKDITLNQRICPYLFGFATASTAEISYNIPYYSRPSGRVCSSARTSSPQVPAMTFQVCMTPEYHLFICNNKPYEYFTKVLTQFLRTVFTTSLTPPHPRAIWLIIYHHPEDGYEIPMVKILYPGDISEVKLIKAFDLSFTQFLTTNTSTPEKFDQLKKIYRDFWILFREE